MGRQVLPEALSRHRHHRREFYGGRRRPDLRKGFGQGPAAPFFAQAPRGTDSGRGEEGRLICRPLRTDCRLRWTAPAGNEGKTRSTARHRPGRTSGCACPRGFQNAATCCRTSTFRFSPGLCSQHWPGRDQDPGFHCTGCRCCLTILETAGRHQLVPGRFQGLLRQPSDHGRPRLFEAVQGLRPVRQEVLCRGCGPDLRKGLFAWTPEDQSAAVRRGSVAGQQKTRERLRGHAGTDCKLRRPLAEGHAGAACPV
mmetsp:Transcript_57561/g.134861  ORF Transcript_57561/g.134861 Transcript_57561/m.134861 type:complete len:254 (+) Transcript_57561:317-1078(+)